MSPSELQHVIDSLRERGLDADADEVANLDLAMEALRVPPGVVARMTRMARDTAAQQWRLALDEWGESQAAFRLLKDRVASGTPLGPEEEDAVRAQAVDFVKSVPAGLVAAATTLVPVPGAALLTPWVLRQLGLLPSRWREEAIVARLRAESARLRQRGAAECALELEGAAKGLERQALEREQAARRCALRTHWDLDGDGATSSDEQRAYEAELGRLTAAVATVGAARRWYLLIDQHVIGPARWSAVSIADADIPLLICLDGESGWVRLDDLRRRVETCAGF